MKAILKILSHKNFFIIKSGVIFFVASLLFFAIGNSWAQPALEEMLANPETAGADKKPVINVKEGISPQDFVLPASASAYTENIYILKGDFETIKTSNLTRISITNPEVADSISADSDYILMMAKNPGQTFLITWDESGKRTRVIHVIEESLILVKERLTQLFVDANIKGISLGINDLEGKVVISGTINKDQKKELDNILEPFRASVLNLVKENEGEQLIQIDAQISELTATYTRNMGFEWTSALTYTETLPGFNTRAPTDFLKVGDFSRTTQILSKINALITEGKGRVLSKPKLVCVSGKEASFLVGGQIPVTTNTTSSGGTVQQNVDYRDYGVNLTVSPTIRNNKIDITLNIEISDIDSANAVGNNVAFSTRSADTQLYLEDGQTVIMAGLIKTNNGLTLKRIPILSDIPILGAIFRTKNATPNSETELIISLTPTILTRDRQEASIKEDLPRIGTTAPLSDQQLMEDYRNELKGRQILTKDAKLREATKNRPAAASQPAAPALDVLTSPSLPLSVEQEIKQKIEQRNEPAVEPQPVSENQEILPTSLEPVQTQEAVIQEQELVSAPDPYLETPMEASADLNDEQAVQAETLPEELIAEQNIVETTLPQPAQEPIAKQPSAPQRTTEEILNSLEVKTYARTIQERIAKQISYPAKAKEQMWQGTVKLNLRILNDGTLASASVKESSGYDVIDQNALSVAKKSAPFVGFPSDANLPILSVTVPIVYSLDRK